MMKRYTAVTIVGLSLALAGCGNLTQLGASVARASLQPETVAQLQRWCGYGKPLLDLARKPVIAEASPTAADIAGKVGPFCDALSAGQVPVTADPNSANWLQANFAGLAGAIGVPFALR